MKYLYELGYTNVHNVYLIFMQRYNNIVEDYFGYELPRMKIKLKKILISICHLYIYMYIYTFICHDI